MTQEQIEKANEIKKKIESFSEKLEYCKKVFDKKSTIYDYITITILGNSNILICKELEIIISPIDLLSLYIAKLEVKIKNLNANAQTWRGEVAKEIKKELNKRLK